MPDTGRPRIFISYRRGDTSPYAGRLYDSLATHFGPGNVFMDIDTIKPGDNFVRVIEDAVEQCDVLLAIIGKRWLTSTDSRRERRLNNPNDFVRLEVKAALERGIRVIPLLVQDAQMPGADALPEPIAELAQRQALELSDARWRTDIARLLTTLEGGPNQGGGSVGRAESTAPAQPARLAPDPPSSTAEESKSTTEESESTREKSEPTAVSAEIAPGSVPLASAMGWGIALLCIAIAWSVGGILVWALDYTLDEKLGVSDLAPLEWGVAGALSGLMTWWIVAPRRRAVSVLWIAAMFAAVPGLALALTGPFAVADRWADEGKVAGAIVAAAATTLAMLVSASRLGFISFTTAPIALSLVGLVAAAAGVGFYVGQRLVWLTDSSNWLTLAVASLLLVLIALPLIRMVVFAGDGRPT